MQDHTIEEEELTRKRLFIRGAAILAAPLFFLYACLEARSGAYLISASMVLLMLLMLSNVWLINRQRFSLARPRITLAICCLLVIVEVIHHDSTSSLMFGSIIPLAAVFVFGWREGLIWALIMWLAIFTLLVNASALNLTGISGNLVDFTASYAISALLALGYETIQARAKQSNLLHMKELKAEQRRLEDFTSIASDWLFELDADLKFTSVSANWAKFMQLPSDTLIGLPVSALRKSLASENDANINNFGANLMAQKPFRDFQFAIKLGERRIHLTTNGEPIFDADGNFTGYRGVARDITEIIESQNLIREKEAELIQSQKMEAIGQLTSGVAHDFNNLLTVINGNLELLKLSLTDQDVDLAKLDAAVLASNRAAELTNKLLAFARRQPLNPKPVDLGKLIISLEDLYRRTLGEQISISLSAADNLWLCHVDPNLLASAILNLAINARDAMPTGGELSFHCENQSVNPQHPVSQLAAGDYVVLHVTDTGEGIRPDHLPHVFEPFFTTKPQGQGSGLGLSMVYGFANQSGGTATLSSSLKRGTTASIYLPKYSGALEPAKVAARVQDDLGSRKVLVVEDEGDVRELVKTMVASLGHEVESAANCTLAREHLRNWQPDILISDVVLKDGETGLELANDAVSLNPATRVLLMSGYPEFALKSNGQLESNWLLLQKPFGRNALNQALQQLYR